MKSITKLLNHWETLGRPIPPSLPDRLGATDRARKLLERVERDDSYVFSVEAESDKDCLYAVAQLAAGSSNSEKELAGILLRSAEWPGDPGDELDELRASVGDVGGYKDPPASPDHRHQASSAVFHSLVAERSEPPKLDSETFPGIAEGLWLRIESAPAEVLDEASMIAGLLADPSWPGGDSEQREGCLGESSLLAGTACRVLFRRDDAHRWFGRAEERFRLAGNTPVDMARLAYQKLALATEERRFEEVLKSAPVLAERFKKLGLADWALKCLFLKGNALRETGHVEEAVAIFRTICNEAEALHNLPLLGTGFGTLAGFHRVAGDMSSALVCAQKALPILEKTNNRVQLAKLRWCVGDILREQGRNSQALASYRLALRESEEVGVRNDVAAIHLVLAELLLDAGLDRDAEAEVRAALPIIDEEGMIPEGYAALGLLRESLRRRKIDRTALRDVHGYFPSR